MTLSKQSAENQHRLEEVPLKDRRGCQENKVAMEEEEMQELHSPLWQEELSLHQVGEREQEDIAQRPPVAVPLSLHQGISSSLGICEISPSCRLTTD